MVVVLSRRHFCSLINCFDIELWFTPLGNPLDSNVIGCIQIYLKVAVVLILATFDVSKVLSSNLKVLILLLPVVFVSTWSLTECNHVVVVKPSGEYIVQCEVSPESDEVLATGEFILLFSWAD
jgi:hypothetical protein